MKFALNIKDRLSLLSVLPVEGNITTLRIVSDLRVKELGFTEEEYQEFNIVTNPSTGRTIWNPAKDREKQCEIGRVGVELIANTLRRLEKEEKLSLDHLHIYEIFVEEKDNSAPVEMKLA